MVSARTGKIRQANFGHNNKQNCPTGLLKPGEVAQGSIAFISGEGILAESVPNSAGRQGRHFAKTAKHVQSRPGWRASCG